MATNARGKPAGIILGEKKKRERKNVAAEMAAVEAAIPPKLRSALDALGSLQQRQ